MSITKSLEKRRTYYNIDKKRKSKRKSRRLLSWFQMHSI